MTHPYQDLPDRAFWRRGVVEADRLAFPDLYEPRVTINRDTPVATAGSCFAQHIGRALREAGCALLDGERQPRMMPDAVARAFGYGLYSARYGNVYTARQLAQLLKDAASGHLDPRFVWARDDRFVDAFRPTIEPEGIDSVEEVLLHRDWHLERVAQVLRRAEVFVFTLGLTEAWEDRATGRVLPVCPGVAGGAFDPALHAFRNFRTHEVLADLHAARALLHRFNPGMRMILTVSPVPLAATAAGGHVLTATMRSKAVLRAAAAEFVEDVADADYFPSYELVTQVAAGGPWFAPNLRDVTPDGVARVMSIFLRAHGLLDAEAPEGAAVEPEDPEEDEAADLVCDEILLQSFAR